MPGVLTAVILLIVYGSLYPWTFRAHPSMPNPLLILFAVHPEEFSRRFIADIIINVALYVPVGMSGYLALPRVRPAFLRFASPVLLGFTLSACIEMTQLYVPGRRCSVVDLVDNTLGSGLGVIIGALFEIAAARKWQGRTSIRVADRSALALLLMWVGSLTFPLFPVMWFYAYRQKIALFIPDALTINSLVTFASAAMSWYAAGRMMEAAGFGRKWLLATVALVPAQFFIITRNPSITELLGTLSGVALTRYVHRWAGCLFIALLILRGLAPFHFGPPRTFSMVPFSGFLATEWQKGIQILLEKTWYFGTGIWLLRASGFRLNKSISTVCTTAAAIEIIQIYLPGRTAEVTDPILALAAGLLIYALTGA